MWSGRRALFYSPGMVAGAGQSVLRGCRFPLVALTVLGLSGCDLSDDAAPRPDPAEGAGEIVRSIVDSEELLLTLSPELARLEASAGNLRIPDHRSASLFAETVRHNDLVSGAAARPEPGFEHPLAQIRHWEIGPARSAPGDALILWRPLLDGVDYLEHAEFTFVRGSFPGDDRDAWEAELGFAALARTKTGAWRSIRAEIETHWTKSEAAEGNRQERAAAWKLDRFALVELRTLDAEERFFAQVGESVLREPAVRARASGSRQEQHILASVREGRAWEPPARPFYVKSTSAQPGLSVVDIDGDGFDDLYVLDRWGKALLLKNRGDGSFDEVAAEWGLDLEDRNCCAAFGDFDNDGDPDVFIGRTYEPSRYLVNDGGRFVDASDRVTGELPSLITSAVSVDYDADGLLDVYFTTYESGAGYVRELQKSWKRGERALRRPLARHLSVRDSRELARLLTDSRFVVGEDGILTFSSAYYRDRPGPPNLLLRNLGDGRFGPAPESEQLALWRNSYQGTWSDYDGDGDVDLYVANDYAPNNLLRNDGDAGFTDVTEETGTPDIGFGMGASWGDYDNDGRHDLYVSNMYSKAGRRITEEVPGLDPRLRKMSRGNTLFRHDGERFERVSGLEPPALRVEKAGWSWGGQFVDIDNDGWLDLYVTSGMYTAPGQIRLRGADQ